MKESWNNGRIWAISKWIDFLRFYPSDIDIEEITQQEPSANMVVPYRARIRILARNITDNDLVDLDSLGDDEKDK